MACPDLTAALAAAAEPLPLLQLQTPAQAVALRCCCCLSAGVHCGAKLDYALPLFQPIIVQSLRPSCKALCSIVQLSHIFDKVQHLTGLICLITCLRWSEIISEADLLKPGNTLSRRQLQHCGTKL